MHNDIGSEVEMHYLSEYLREALIYYDKKRDWNKIVERGMSKDFSWKSSAKQYEELYDDM